jgi:hypothetical protein
MKQYYLIFKLFKIISSSVFWTDSEFQKVVKSYIGFFIFLRTKNGIHYAIPYFKNLRLHITRFICGIPLQTNQSFIGLDKDGFPKRFSKLKDYIIKNRSNVNRMRAVMTLILFTRAIDPTPKELEKVPVKFDSIIDPYKGSCYTIPNKFIIDFINFYGFKGKYKFNFSKDAFFSMKSSPFGESIKSSFYSILGLSSSIYNSLYHLCKINGNEE